ncbi:putative ornithine cyclodeaminase, mu-crystallin (plasmid) [Thioflavicoccus mobilis 8321]|uniref:Putative ornithine cyclodeaminase, mu-crystallin n=1 Tax=Thioflavicoccus mobilis 8321 TaxID=765912 RepID=L0H2A8_9GAMM|nr:ornithine cyclodeaminase, mu-crystallin [Thioflavicoccus mobilis]AGA92366.1 putative ornithine cyclodeaminase, mu-crystallin [Thioflavicoccus mobilis 8321]
MPLDSAITILTAADIVHMLSERHAELKDIVIKVYTEFGRGTIAVPPAAFLRPKANRPERFIALPAYLAYGDAVAGVKWIGSFPRNTDDGLERASAVIVLNSPADGRPLALLEGATISAIRTAMSALVLVETIRKDRNVSRIGVIGCGRIAFAVCRLLATEYGCLKGPLVYDADSKRAQRFAQVLKELEIAADVVSLPSQGEILRDCQVVVFATTATEPHLALPDPNVAGQVILHLSLRDIEPESMWDAINIVDSQEHAFREGTSLGLARRLARGNNMEVVEISDLLAKERRIDVERGTRIIFSPFGLGALDVALAHYVWRRSAILGVGVQVPGFLGTSWNDAKAHGEESASIKQQCGVQESK